MKISIIGSGVVGSIVGEGLKQLGHTIIFHDIDASRIEKMKSKGYDATNDVSYAINNSDISFLCLPSPTEGGKINISYISSAAENVGNALKDKDGYHVIVVKSTVTPTTTESVIIPILENHSGKKIGRDFGVCMNPEFLTEIANTWTDDSSFARGFFDEERMVIGEFDKRSGDTLNEIYAKLNKPIFRTDLKTAEFIKYAANCALANRISYWNEIFLIGKKLDIDSNLVANVVSLDKRIGKYGTIHGKAYGGKCLDKDMKAFISWAKSHHEPSLLKAVDEINDKMKKEYGVRE